MSSYNSRTTHGTSTPKVESRKSTRHALLTHVVHTTAPQASATSRSIVRQGPVDRVSRGQAPDHAVRQDSVSSRFSRILGSMTSRSRARTLEAGTGMAASGPDVSKAGTVYTES